MAGGSEGERARFEHPLLVRSIQVCGVTFHIFEDVIKGTPIIVRGTKNADSFDFKFQIMKCTNQISTKLKQCLQKNLL